MERYNRAYRDLKSPLTPLTPLSHQNVFNFNSAAHLNLTKRSSPNGKPQTLPVRYSEKFLKIRSVFERKEKCKVTVTCVNYLEVPAARPKRHRAQSQSKQQRQKEPKMLIVPISPIAPQPLSPRTSDLLGKVGMVKYRGLFQREEIDIQVLRTLTTKDLIYLGITCSVDQKELLKAIEFASEFY